MNMTNLEKYNAAFILIFQVNVELLDDKFSFREVVEWSSLAHLTLISELEDTFDIMFDTEHILNFGSYENGKRILTESYGISFNE